MQLCMQDWSERFVRAVESAFGARIVCAGIQGSRARGEATPSSDIDTVLILDELTIEDLSVYRALLQTLPDAGLICGFVSGKAELACWEPYELVSFYFDTLPLRGDLEFLRPNLTAEAARMAVHSGACGIYHACCHNVLFDRSAEALLSLYKAAFFVLRAKAFFETGEFFRREDELLQRLCAADRAVLVRRAALAKQAPNEKKLAEESDLLLQWSGALIREYAE
ncbi:MAG TPA: nucleotidyltransferase domain-containing protein [Candidatus Cryosericum sp.]|nr:nucleotidyltransferase domain-containing protein [Candidatus Cryosericum sp.]